MIIDLVARYTSWAKEKEYVGLGEMDGKKLTVEKVDEQ